MRTTPLRAPNEWLEAELVTLDFASDHFAPLIWRDALGLAGLAFLDGALAEQHLARLKRAGATSGGAQAGPRPRLARLTAGDLRARQEWLEAVLHAGAARVLFDLDATGATRGSALTGALLAEVLSHKRGLACL